MKVEVNLNDIVKVKLTEHGINIMKKQQEELNELIRKNGGKEIDFTITIDDDGYWSTSLWDLMRRFGNQIDVCFEEPFDINILIESR